jgi:hypothetical protein
MDCYGILFPQDRDLVELVQNQTPGIREVVGQRLKRVDSERNSDDQPAAVAPQAS